MPNEFCGQIEAVDPFEADKVTASCDTQGEFINPGDSLTVVVDFENQNAIDAFVQYTITVNGIAVAEGETTVRASATESVSESITLDFVGEYEIGVTFEASRVGL